MQTNSMQAYAYKEARVKTSSQGQIIVMLYDAAIRNIDHATEKLQQGSKSLDEIHNAFTKARDIITELACSLDMEAGGDFAEKMFSLYMWFNKQLMEADVSKSAAPAQVVRELLAELRGAWAQIAGKTSVEGRAVSGVNVAG